MKPVCLPLAFLLALLIACSGCSDDPATPPGDDPTVAQGTLVPAGPDFEIELEFAAGPDSLHRGPFLLRGRNLRYSEDFRALSVEFTITNNGDYNYAEPVTIDFFRLIPETTIILNSPDDSGFFTFEFANDDLWWTPGEESFPLTVMFSALSGQSVGFNAHIGVGGPMEAGIGGRVWLDGNRDGLMQPDEGGVPGIPLVVDDGSPQEILRMAYTDTGGYYMFPGLESGVWEVRVLTIPDGLMSTTPANMHVLLAPAMGSGGFTQADFGFAPFVQPGLGPFLTVEGDSLGTVVGKRGVTEATFAVTAGFPLDFRWQAVPDAPGGGIAWYRHGWDIVDPDDPMDPGWEVAAGLLPENFFSPRKAFRSGLHTLLVECEDTMGNRTRVVIRIEVVLR